jgi:cytochrome c oxidase subunit I+III
MVFIFMTFKWWLLTALGGVLFLAALLTWLWTGTAEIPEKKTKDIGDGIQLPLYVSGYKSTGWWAMFITMTGDLTAFLALLFGYFFFWTIHPDFPPSDINGPGWVWPLVAGLMVLLTWGLTLGARIINSGGQSGAAQVLLAAGLVVTVLAGLAMAAGPWSTGLDPTVNSYPAIVWALVLWVLAHLIAGLIMQAYALARLAYGKASPTHDADLWNIALYWHFTAFSGVLTALVIGGFPYLT